LLVADAIRRTAGLTSDAHYYELQSSSYRLMHGSVAACHQRSHCIWLSTACSAALH